MNHESVTCKPKPYYWLLGILVAPFCGLIFTSVLIRPILMLIGIDLVGKELIILMVAVAFISLFWMYYTDYRNTRYEVNDCELKIGRYPFKQVIPISEISTVVIGLPACIPWWISICRFLPLGIGPFPIVMLQRKQTLLLRLSNQRLLPICLYSNPCLQLSNEFTQNLLLLLADKIAPYDSYTDKESKALCRSRLNKIIHLPN